MIRRLFRLLVPSGLLLAAVLLVRRTVRLRDEGARVVPSPDRWPPISTIPTGDGPAVVPPTVPRTADPIAPPNDTPQGVALSLPTAEGTAPPGDVPDAVATDTADGTAPPDDLPEGVATDNPTSSPATAAWLPPVDGRCPPTHLIKVKEASGIYHLPGMLNYERTKPDRCYADESAAVTDGFIKSKR